MLSPSLGTAVAYATARESTDGENILLPLLALVELVGTGLGFLLEVELSIVRCNTKQVVPCIKLRYLMPS